MDDKCFFCGETRKEMLYNRGKKKICSVCMGIIIDTINAYFDISK